MREQTNDDLDELEAAAAPLDTDNGGDTYHDDGDDVHDCGTDKFVGSENEQFPKEFFPSVYFQFSSFQMRLISLSKSGLTLISLL